MPKIDLHFHSTYSDGKLSIPELAERIKERGLKYCALTDHDTIAGINELQDCLRGSGITVIPGVELTAKFGDNDFHVLAYDFDLKPVAEILEERNEIVRLQKIAEMKEMIELFKSEGLKITDNLTPDEKRPVGFTLSTDICQQQFNQDIFAKKYGKTLIPEDIYFEYQAPGKTCAVEKSGVDVEWLLGKLKGVAADLIIAHPFLEFSVAAHPLSEKDIFLLLDMGFSGVEVYHEKVPADKIEWLKKLVKERNLHYTGGSDSHGNKNKIDLGLYGPDLEVPDFKITNFGSV